MRILPDRRFDHFVDDMPGRGLVGIAHAKIDDVLSRGSGLCLQLIDDIEYIGWQTTDSVKLFHERSWLGLRPDWEFEKILSIYWL